METILSNPKDKPYRDKAYLSYIESLPCAKCGNESSYYLDIVCHHEKLGGESGGTGTKPHDTFTVPLCMICHNNRGLLGRDLFWNDTQPAKDLKLIIIKCLHGYISRQGGRV